MVKLVRFTDSYHSVEAVEAIVEAAVEGYEIYFGRSMAKVVGLLTRNAVEATVEATIEAAFSNYRGSW